MNHLEVCRHLRTKSMFIPALEAGPNPETDEVFGHTTHCWCNCTLAEAGPDDQAVSPERCIRSRSCFEEP